jgi:hypothetical protein
MNTNYFNSSSSSSSSSSSPTNTLSLAKAKSIMKAGLSKPRKGKGKANGPGLQGKALRVHESGGMIMYDDVGNSKADVYRFVQHITPTAQWSTAITGNGGAQSFALNGLDQYTTFTALYDQYRIARIDATWFPQTNYSPTQPNVGVAIPLTFIYVDYDDSTVPTAGLARQRQDAVVKTSNCKEFTISWVPHVAVAGFTGTFTGYTNIAAPWIDCASPAIVHYGLKWWQDNVSAGVTNMSGWLITYKLHLEFRNTI